MNFQPKRVVETAVCVDHLARTTRFFPSVLNLKLMVESPVFVACNIGDRNALLLFKRNQSLKTKFMMDREIPPHNASGRTHVSFAIDREGLPAGKHRLSDKGISIEWTISAGLVLSGLALSETKTQSRSTGGS